MPSLELNTSHASADASQIVEATLSSDPLSPDELIAHLNDLERNVQSQLINERWRVPSSSQSPEWTAARITEQDGTTWLLSMMGTRPGGTHIQVERARSGAVEKMELTVPFPDTPFHQLNPHVSYRRFRQSGELAANSPQSVTAAKKLAGELGALNGTVIRVENIITSPSKQLVFEAPKKSIHH